MKLRDIQRAAQVPRIEREPGDEPSLGRLARVRVAMAPKGARRRRKRQDPGAGGRGGFNQRKVVMAWSALLAVVALSVLGGALWLWMQDSMERNADVETMPQPVSPERVVSRFESPTEDVALEQVKRALMIRDPGQVAEYFRPGSASPEAVVGFLRDLGQRDGVITGYQWLSSLDANGLLLDGVVVSTLAEGKPSNRLAMLTPDDKGKWKIDFDAFARTVKPAWSELLNRTAAEGLVRVMLAKDSYYNGDFRDEERWICYKIASPDLDDFLLGYCAKGSPQAQALNRIEADRLVAGGDRGASRATLQLRRVADTEARQFEITRVLAEDWVLATTPFDQNFK